MPNIGPAELVLVLLIALIVLGPKRLPGVGRSLGSGIREFKESIGGAGDEQRTAEEDHPPPVHAGAEHGGLPPAAPAPSTGATRPSAGTADVAPNDVER